jgi:pumilio family protein 6
MFPYDLSDLLSSPQHMAICTDCHQLLLIMLCCVVLCHAVQGHLEEMLTHKHAHRVLMQLLAPGCHRYLPPAIYAIIHPPTKTMLVSAAAAAGGAAGGGLDEDEEEPDFAAEGDEDSEQQQQQQQHDEGSDGFDDEAEEGPSGDEGGGNGSEDEAAAAAAGDEGVEGANGSSDAAMVSKQLGESKKDPQLRRQELLGSGPGSVAADLLRLCADQAVQLLASPVGGEVLVEVARGAAGGLLWQHHQAGVQAVHQALVQQLQQDVQALSSSSGKQQQKGKKGKGASSSDADAGAAEPLLTHYFGSRALRRLLLAAGGEGPEGDAARAFAEQLWQQALQGQCKHLVGGHAEKVLAALLHCSVGSVEQAAAAELQGLVGGDVQLWSAKFLGPPGQHEQQQQQGKHHKQQQRQAQQQQAAGSSKPQQKKKHKAH